LSMVNELSAVVVVAIYALPRSGFAVGKLADMVAPIGSSIQHRRQVTSEQAAVYGHLQANGGLEWVSLSDTIVP